MEDLELLDLKLPPFSLEAEQSVLGGLMLDSSAFDLIADLLAEEDFYQFAHKLIFRQLAAMILQGQQVDVITLSETLERTGQLQTVGGLSYLGSLAANTPSAANIHHYARIVRERRVLRELAAAGKEISELAYAPQGRTTAELLDAAEARIFRLSAAQMAAHGGFVEMPAVMHEVIQRIEMAAEVADGVTGLRSGFADLDQQTQGFQPGDLILVAGRPSMGKTAFALNIAEHVACQIQQPVAIFSMEMPPAQLGLRMLAAVSGLDFGRMSAGQLYDDEWETLIACLPQLANARIYIEDTATHTPQQLRALARRKHRECGGLGLIIVDYLQMLSSDPGRGTENRNNEVAGISRALKQLAKELNVPVIALTQLNRSLEQRPNKRPIMSDLRDSGGLEQDADLILFLYRDEVYRTDSPAAGVAEVIIGKQRNGPIGTVELVFSGATQRFGDRTSS